MTLSPLTGWIARRPIVSAGLALAALVALLTLAPIWPYEPHCGAYGSASWRTLEGRTTAAFRHALAAELEYWGKPHIVIGDRIYVQFLRWLDGDVVADVHVYRRLLRPKVSSYPPFFEWDCDLIRSLVIQHRQVAS